MPSYDYAMLSGRIKERYGSQREFAKAISLSERSLSLKMRGRVDWRQGEIKSACQLLGISSEEISRYFFALKVQN